MSHWLVAPILLPLLTGATLLLLDGAPPQYKRRLGTLATFALLPLAAHLIGSAASGTPQVYYLGDWPAPFGIVLVLDRLSAVMLLLTALLALASVLHANATRDDAGGPHFHALFQFQLLGINGSFLTGDLFNLFVFFEVLLIASYCLLMHGANAARTRAALHVVLLNLTGSALFLIALGLVYGVSGSLNMADVAERLGNVSADDVGLARAAGLLLLVVFGLKAAFVPLGFWLPGAYSVASAPVACLFAIMTKVGAYAILRVHGMVFTSLPGDSTSLAEPWLLPVALLTIVLGSLGLAAASSLRVLVAYLVVVSVGTLLAGIGLFSRAAISASLFYLVHSTLVTGGLFLLADLIARQRGSVDDRLDLPQSVAQPAALGALFFVGAIAIAGLPPASGFLTKVLLLQAAIDTPPQFWLWGVVLASGLLMVICLARAGSALFWRIGNTSSPAPAAPWAELLPCAVLIASAAVLVIAAAPVERFLDATATDLVDGEAYISRVLANAGVSTPASVVEGKP